MKTSLQYFKDFLTVLINSNKPFVDYTEISNKLKKIELTEEENFDMFLLHDEIIASHNLIKRKQWYTKGRSDTFLICSVPFEMTDKGRMVYDLWSSPRVWEVLNNTIPNSSLEAALHVSNRLKDMWIEERISAK